MANVPIVGAVGLEVTLDDQKLPAQAKSSAGKAESILTDRFKSVGRTIAGALSVAALAKFGAGCIQLGSDLAEVQNVVDVTFPTMAGKVNDFAKSAITSIGMSQKMTKEYMGQVGSMAEAFGYSESAAYDMAEAVTKLTGDTASFYNLSQDEAFAKLKSVFTGETESLKSLGVVMTQSALDQYALANGFGKTTSEMSEQEKVALRLSFVESSLGNAQGDFARTSDGWANSTRVLTLRFQELRATIGQGLINALTPVIRVINTILAKLQTLANYFVAFTKVVFGDAGGASSSTKAISDNMASAAGATGGLTTGLGNANKAAGSVAGNLQKAKGFLAGFDSLTVLKSQSESAASGSGSGDSSSGGSGGYAGGIGADDLSIPTGAVDTSGVDEAYAKVKGFLDKILGVINQYKPIILAALGGITAGFAAFEIVKNWAGISAFFTAMVGPLQTLTAAFSVLWTGLTDGEGLLVSLQAIFGTASGTALFFAGIVAAVTAALVYLYNTSDSFRALVQEALGALMGILQNFYDSILAPLGMFLTDLFNTIIVPIAQFIANVFVKAVQTIATIVLSFWTNVLAPIANFLIDVLGIALQTVIDIWNGWKPAIETIMNGLQSVWDNVLSPVADWIAGTFSKVFEDWGAMINDVIPDAEGIFKGLSEFLTGVFTLNVDKVWNGFETILKNFLSFLDKIFGTNFSASFDKIVSVLNIFKSGAQQAFDGVKQVFSGLIQFIKGVFTGNWSSAWQGIVNIFSGIFQGIAGVVKGPINAVISIVNGAVSRINGFGFDVPSWVPVIGGKSFRVNVPRIPLLAEGGYVQPNMPRLAVVGDNRHEGEIVSPESKIYEQTSKAIDEALARRDGVSGSEAIVEALNEILSYLQNNGLELDTDGLIKVIRKRQRQLDLAKGGAV